MADPLDTLARALVAASADPVADLAALPSADLSVGSVVLVGDYNWRKGPLWPSLCALVLGRRQRFTHLGMHCTVAWWRDRPYLIGIAEVDV
tara:strand:- start:640 stop:912 length:273 start_codon:yes stop_codon:yes gene_type:complete